MDKVQSGNVPTLTVTDQPVIGIPFFHLPVESPETMVPALIDIYAELLSLHRKVDTLLDAFAVQQNTLTVLIEDTRELPWVRLWRWLRRKGDTL